MQIALEMALEGASNSNIRKFTNLSLSAIEKLKLENRIDSESIRRKMRKTGLRPSTVPKNLREKIIALRESGIGLAQISRELQLPYSTVYNILGPVLGRGTGQPERTDNGSNGIPEKRARNELLDSRNMKVMSLSLLGKTLQEIANEVGVTRERVRQILLEADMKRPIEVRHELNLDAGRKLRDNSDHLRNWIRQHPGCYLSEIAAQFGVQVSEQELSIPSDVRHLVSGLQQKKAASERLVWSREQIIMNLKTASLQHNPLSMNLYSELLDEDVISGPTVSRIVQIFGSWSSACVSAGINCGDTPVIHYERQWNRDSIAFHLGQFLMESDSFSFRKYDMWSRKHIDTPGQQTVRNQVGGKLDCLNLAHQYLRKRWFHADEEKRSWTRE